MDQEKQVVSIRVGGGLTVHMGRKAGGRWVALCGAGANRTGRNISPYGHPVELAVTCKRCQVRQVQMEEAKRAKEAKIGA